MKKYLSEFHTKPRHHKRNFALLVSGVVTLFIFGVWSMVKFSEKPVVVKDTTGPVDLAAAIESTGGIGEAVDNLKSVWGELTKDGE